MAPTNNEPDRLIFANAFSKAEQIENVAVLLQALAAQTLPMDPGSKTSGKEPILEDVIRNMGQLGANAALVGAKSIEFDALGNGSFASINCVVVTEPDSGRDVGWHPKVKTT